MLRKVKWYYYNSLGNLELDFTKPDGSEYNTIILAGENGTGKTTILETLSTYLNMMAITPFEFIEYSADGQIYSISPRIEKQNADQGFHIRREKDTDKFEDVFSGKYNNREILDKDPKDIRYYGVAYSKARSGFNTKQVTSTTTLQVDQDKYEDDEDEDYTRIKQLLVDIEEQDANDWMKISREGHLSDRRYKKFEMNSKGYRFKNAFNSFFENVKYEGVDNTDPNEKRVIFKKYGRSVSVDQLSTGEKQIVFRGAHLLRHVNSIMGGIVLIDEPELSMHPKWQKKILDYYRGLFTNNGSQSVQMIIATHSEYVIQSALKDRDNVLVIVLSDDSGIIKCKHITAPNVLPSVTAAETNYLAFGVPSIDYHIELYGYLQTKTGSHYVEDCDQYISQQPQYDSDKHNKPDRYKRQNYKTLPTYIRNAIDHPDSRRKYTEEELKSSIELLIELCK